MKISPSALWGRGSNLELLRGWIKHKSLKWRLNPKGPCTSTQYHKVKTKLFTFQGDSESTSQKILHYDER